MKAEILRLNPTPLMNPTHVRLWVEDQKCRLRSEFGTRFQRWVPFLRYPNSLITQCRMSRV